ncbi:hypothetical protein LTR15_003136 [Elasticomyces elasticus]|nr:hypothetical protein LTR15_003136 [Elasticomyces elasticus]
MPSTTLTALILFSLSIATSIEASQLQWPLGPSNTIWDGRIPSWIDLEDFDSPTLSPYNETHVHGYRNWSDYIRLPTNVKRSLFDYEHGTVPLEVTVDDTSLFLSGGENPQYGFRRSELNPVSNNGTNDHFGRVTISSVTRILDSSTAVALTPTETDRCCCLVDGKRTLHFSVRADDRRPLNFTHEYQNVFLETNAYDAHQFTLKTGTPYDNSTSINSSAVTATQTLRIQSGTNAGALEKTLFETEYSGGTWHNFAVELDFDANTLAAYYSKDYANLELVVPATANNNSGGGLYHFGIIKLPASGTGNGSVPFSGYQPSNIEEGQIYGGIFIEDTSEQPLKTGVWTSGYVF